MAFKHGKSTTVLVGAVDYSAYLNAAELGIDVDTADTSTFGSSWKTSIVGNYEAKASFGGFYDPTTEQLPGLVAVEFGTVLTYCPAGALAVGDLARLASIASTTYAESSPIGDAVAIKWDAMASGAIGNGKILHVTGVDTGTTVGSSTDDAAATTTGWTAHLHVTAVSSGSWVVKLEDSANNSAWADVTGGAFTAATGATSQRLQGAAGSTLRRYVRYTATVTGGSSPTITFALAYSRNN
jgi:hypothetical protein